MQASSNGRRRLAFGELIGNGPNCFDDVLIASAPAQI